MAETSSDNRGPVLATIATNADGWFQAVSPQFLEMFGGSVEALAGVNAVDLVHPMQASAMRRALASAQTVDEQTVATQLFLDDTWSPIVIVIDRMVDERSTWRLYRPVTVPAPSLLDGSAEDTAITAAVSPADTADGATPPAVSVLASPAAPPSPVALPRPVASLSPAEDVAALSSPADVTGARLPVEIAGGFPYEDSVAHTTYVASMPSDGVPEQRDAVRRSGGDDSTPMLEIDADGRTIFVRGCWDEISPEGGRGADVFEELLEKNGNADSILAAIDRAIETAEPSNHELLVSGLPPRWVRVLPIPSPHVAGVVHALVAVVAESAIDAAANVAVDAPSGQSVRLDKVPGTISASNASPSTDAAREPHNDSSSPSTAEHLDLTESRTPNRSRLAMFAGLAILAGVIVLVIASLLGDDAPQPEPVSVNLIETEVVQVTDQQTWQSVGAESLGELQGIATTPDGGFVAEVDGRLVRLDAGGATIEVISVRGGDATFITDIDADDTGAVWVLDAGIGRVSRVAPDGTVTALVTNPALLNARGAGVGLGNTLFVAATASAQLIEVGLNGEFVRDIALPGRQPSDVTQAADGTLWMIDAEQLELVHLSEDGELLSALALESFTSLQSPHLTFAGDVLWVTAPEASAILAIDIETGQPTGERIELTRPDGTAVNKPIGIAATADGQLWTLDSTAGAIITVTVTNGVF